MLPVRPLEQPEVAEPVVWVGAVSFEERCLGSLRMLAEMGITVCQSVVLDYPTHAEPRNVDITRRQGNRKVITELLDSLSATEDRPLLAVHPYRPSSLRAALRRVDGYLDGCGERTTTIIDVTCLTKVHALACALWVARRDPRRRVIIAYSQPAQYGTPARHQARVGKWADVVLAPIVLNPGVYAEGANGLVLLGHEGHRLTLALSQLLPEEALIMLWKSTEREELGIVTRTANGKLLAQVERGERSGWSLQEYDYSGLGELQSTVSRFVQSSVTAGRRVVLYPFGPKPLVFTASVTAIKIHPEAVWYCYPVPKSYDVDYTVGIGRTRWLSCGEP